MKLTTLLQESSLSRLYSQYKNYDSGTISACRYAEDCGDGKRYNKSDNKLRTNQLKSKLLSMGYGITKVSGTYIENYKSDNEIKIKEDSFIVFDIKNKKQLKTDLIKLGSYFDQDSITFSQVDGNYYLISTNKCESGYPGFGKIGVEIKLGKPMFGKNGEFYSSINGRPFVFENIVDVNMNILTDYSISEIRSIKEVSKSVII